MGRLPLVPGMPVTVTENLSIENKIVNGSQGTVKDIIYRTVPEGQEVVCAYVNITSSPLAFDGLDESVVPIFPKSTQFTYSPTRGNRIRVSRTRLPLVPAWAFTDYKVQGASMPNVVVDLGQRKRNTTCLRYAFPCHWTRAPGRSSMVPLAPDIHSPSTRP